MHNRVYNSPSWVIQRYTAGYTLFPELSLIVSKHLKPKYSLLYSSAVPSTGEEHPFHLLRMLNQTGFQLYERLLKMLTII